jgi:hypothetical protein
MDRKNFFGRSIWHRAKGSPVEKALLPLARLYGRISRLRKNVWVLSGTVGGEPLSILFAGGKTDKAYIAELAFRNNFKERCLGNAWLWSMPFLFKKMKKDCQVGIFEMEGRFMKFLGKGFFVPAWVGGEVDLADADRLKLDSKKSDVRKIRKYGLSHEVTSDPARFDEFYRLMYRPHISKAHGEKAHYTSLEEVKTRLGECELMLIKKGPECLGGGIIHYRKESAKLWVLGMAEVTEDCLKSAATAGFDHFAEERLKQKGYARMHYGGSRPFLKDGVLQYKRHRGLVLKDHVKRGFLVSISSVSPGVRDFLVENPFLYLKDGDIAGAIFMEADKVSSGSITSTYEDYYIPGMRGLDVFTLGGAPPDAKGLVPPELAGKIEISDF